MLQGLSPVRKANAHLQPGLSIPPLQNGNNEGGREGGQRQGRRSPSTHNPFATEDQDVQQQPFEKGGRRDFLGAKRSNQAWPKIICAQGGRGGGGKSSSVRSIWGDRRRSAQAVATPPACLPDAQTDSNQYPGFSSLPLKWFCSGETNATRGARLRFKMGQRAQGERCDPFVSRGGEQILLLFSKII